MAGRVQLSESAFVRRMLEVHAKIEAEILVAAAEAKMAEDRAIAAAAVKAAA